MTTQPWHCQLSYIVPALIKRRAREKAKQHVMEAAGHMALEQQILSQSQIESEIERLAESIFKERPNDLWND